MKRKYIILDGLRMTQQRLQAMKTAYFKLKDIKETADHYKGTYFWKPPSSSGIRRHMERKNHFGECVELPFLGLKINFHLSLSVSCKHVYKTQQITFNGERKTLQIVNRLIEELEDVLVERNIIKNAA